MRGSHCIATSLALAILGLAAVASAAPCAIKSRAAHVRKVKIEPGGGSPFFITLERLPIEARPLDNKVASLEVERPLRFTTEHPLNSLGVKLKKRTSIKEGRLVLAKGLTATFLDSEKFDPKRSDAVMRVPLFEMQPVAPLAIPCDALTVPGTDSWESSSTPAIASAEKEILHATASSAFPLFTKRKAVDPWMIKFTGPLTVVKRSGPWVKLRAKWSDGSILQGWSNSEELEIRDAVPLGGMGSLGSIGMGHCGRSHHRSPIPYVLKANAPIQTRAQGAIWAHTAGVIKVMAFPLSRSDGWLQIASIEGLPPESCSDHNKFWVHADHIQWTNKPL